MVELKIPTSIYFKKRKNRLNSKFFLFLALFIIFGAGIGMRLINFTNPPLDFQAWRQLRSASIARGMYYEMDPSADPKSRELAVEIANQFDIMEPTVFERLVAATYLLLGGEYLFIPRLYAILFWTIGGIGIFLPGLLLIYFIYPIWEKLKQIKAIKISLRGINAIAAGLISVAAIVLMQKSGLSYQNLLITIVTVLLLLSKKIAQFLFFSILNSKKEEC